MKKLTDRQIEVLNFIKNFIDKENYSPSYREIAAHFGINEKASNDHVKALIRKGYVKSEPGISRSFQITKKEVKK